MPVHPFPLTSWSLVARAGAPATPEGREALATFCKAYWFPVYAFIRRRGSPAEEALDRTQGFFADLIGREDLADVDPTLGRKFRSWLLACVQHYLARKYRYDHARKRHPGEPLESLEAAAAEGRYQAEASHRLTPERQYERAFAGSVLERVIGRIQARYEAAGKARLFDALKGSLTADVAQRRFAEVAAEERMTEDAVKQAAHRLRDRYKKELRNEAAALVNGPGERDGPGDAARIDEELRELLAALED